MILLYKKTSEPESAYKKVSEDTKFSISVLLLKAGVSYDFITQDKEGIYWSLFDQKSNQYIRMFIKKELLQKLSYLPSLQEKLRYTLLQGVVWK